MKYNHDEFTEARVQLHESRLKSEEATQKLKIIQDAVKKHFLALAEKYDYSFCFDDSTLLDPVERFLIRSGRVEEERFGKGMIYVDLPEGKVSISDPSGKLAEILESVGISTVEPKLFASVNLDIQTASERLHEVLDIHHATRSLSARERSENLDRRR